MTQAVRVVVYSELLPFVVALYAEIDYRLRYPHGASGPGFVFVAIYLFLWLCAALSFVAANLALAIAASRKHIRWVIAIGVTDLLIVAVLMGVLFWVEVFPALSSTLTWYLAIAVPAALILAYTYWADTKADSAAREEGQRVAFAVFSLIGVLAPLGAFLGAIAISGPQAHSADPNAREGYYGTLFGLYMPAVFCALWLSVVVGAMALVRAARRREWAWGAGLLLAALPAIFLLLSDLFLHLDLGALVPGGDHRGQAQFLVSLALQAPLPITTLAYCLIVRPRVLLPVATPAATTAV